MKVLITTDLEGVAGVQTSEDWCRPEGRYYETGKELLTGEINAAIAGFFKAGAKEVAVADGHGSGAINPLLLDKRAELIAQWFAPAYLFMLDKSYDACAWVGRCQRRGRIDAMEMQGPSRVISAMAPLSEMFGYSNVIRTISQGRAGYTMHFERYETVPFSLAEEIVKQRHERAKKK